MIVTEPRYRVLDPTAGPEREEQPMAPGIKDLSGKRIGLLHNNKRGGLEFLEFLAEMISKRYPGVTFVHRSKLDVSTPCPPAILDDLVGQTDLVITAIGD